MESFLSEEEPVRVRRYKGSGGSDFKRFRVSSHADGDNKTILLFKRVLGNLKNKGRINSYLITKGTVRSYHMDITKAHIFVDPNKVLLAKDRIRNLTESWGSLQVEISSYSTVEEKNKRSSRFRITLPGRGPKRVYLLRDVLDLLKSEGLILKYRFTRW